MCCAGQVNGALPQARGVGCPGDWYGAVGQPLQGDKDVQDIVIWGNHYDQSWAVFKYICVFTNVFINTFFLCLKYFLVYINTMFINTLNVEK